MEERIILAVSAAIMKDDRFLLVRRGREPSRGLFAFPGGRVVPGETLEEAVRRELMEETSLTAGSFSFFREITLGDPAVDAVAYRLSIFRGSYVGGEAVAGDDADRVGWYLPQEMRFLPMTPSTLAIAEEIAAARSDI